MPTTIHFVRHAQGFHNLYTINQQIPDPFLTPHGKDQCAALNRAFPFHDKITHLVASPMRRTVYTCLYSFTPAVEAGKVVVALPEVQEVSALPCDTGSEPAVLRAEFGDKADFSLLQPGWNDKSGGSKWAPQVNKLEARAKEARLWLRKLGQEAGGDPHIVVVTHGGFLHFITQDWDGMNMARGTGWENTEYRSYEFKDPSGQDPDASLKETNVSWRRRRGSAIGLTETEQRQLRAVLQSDMQKEFDKELSEQFLNAGSEK